MIDRRRIYPVLFLAWSLIILSDAHGAQPAPWLHGQSQGKDLRIKLVTIDPGDELYMWWGHTALIVEDLRLGAARFYNYGLFSFDQKNFFTNFAKGRLFFQVGASNPDWELSRYRAINRGIRIQVLNLTPEKRLEMAKFLEINILPENREYMYDHYYDNCATRIRDFIDKMVGGRLAAETQKPGRMTLRRHTRRHTDRYFFMDWLLMFLMGDSIDKPIMEWDDMFLPVELENYVGNLSYVDEEGRTRPLVAEAYVFYEAKGRRPVPEKAPVHWPTGMLIGLSLGGAVFLLAFWLKSGRTAARIAFGLYNSFVGLIYGLPGLALFFMSLFTDHTVTYHNENLFLANPLTFLAIPLGICIALNGKRCRKWMSLIWTVLAVMGLVSLLLKLLPSFDQQNWLSLAAILPVSTAFALAGFLILKNNNFELKRSEKSTEKQAAPF